MIVITIFVCPLLAAGVMAYKDYIAYNHKTFIVEIQSSEPGLAQVFFDIGNGYNEDDSTSMWIHKNDFRKYAFPLTAKTIKSIRFDPIEVPATVRIKDAWIENKLGEVVKIFTVNDFQAVQQIKKIEVCDSALIIQTSEYANDPILTIQHSNVDHAVGWRNLLRVHGGKYLGYALLCLFGVIGLVSFVIFSRRNQYKIHKQWNFEILMNEKPMMSILLLSMFAVILFGVKLWLIGAYGNATPFWDQWNAEADYLYKPFLEGTLEWTSLFTPHNEHRIFTTRLLSLALLRINGIWNPLLQMVVNAGLHIAALILSIALLTKVVGRMYLPALLLFSLLLFGIPYNWQNTLESFQTQFYLVLLFSILSLWYTVTQNPLSVRWWVGVFCGILAFFSFASGVFAFAAAAIIGFLYYFTKLRKACRQILASLLLAGLFCFGVVLTPTVPYHAYLKAASFTQFLGALKSILGWPISPAFISAFILHVPSIAFVGITLWKRPPANDNRWFLLAFALWTLGQAVSIAYGRAVGSLASRYLDLFAIGILINFTCLISLMHNYFDKRRSMMIAGISIWCIGIGMCLGLFAAQHSVLLMKVKHTISLSHEFNVRSYVTTGDFNHLKNKHIPFHHAELLASILSSSAVQSILPSNIRRPLEPVSVSSKPVGAFAANGYYPEMSQCADMAWGSYRTKEHKTAGETSIKFNGSGKSVLLAIPVAGYPLNSGMKLEVEQNGRRYPIIMNNNPKESWGIAYLRISGDAFSLHLVDASRNSWLAVSTPFVAGRFDPIVRNLLANYHIFFLAGSILGLFVFMFGMTCDRKKSVQT